MYVSLLTTQISLLSVSVSYNVISFCLRLPLSPVWHSLVSLHMHERSIRLIERPAAVCIYYSALRVCITTPYHHATTRHNCYSQFTVTRQSIVTHLTEQPGNVQQCGPYSSTPCDWKPRPSTATDSFCQTHSRLVRPYLLPVPLFPLLQLGPLRFNTHRSLAYTTSLHCTARSVEKGVK